MNLLVLLKAGHVGEVLLANTAVIRESLAVNLHVALQVSKLTKGLSAIRTAVTSHLRVALEFQMVSEGFQAETTVEQISRMSLFMVEKRSSVSIGASALVTPTKENENYSKIMVRIYNKISIINSAIDPVVFRTYDSDVNQPPKNLGHIVVYSKHTSIPNN